MTTLPLMAIRETVAFPGSMTPFVVGRAASVRAIEEALAADQKIVLVTQRDATVEDPAAGDLFEVGTVAGIAQSLRLPDGNFKLLAEGLVRARVGAVSHVDGVLRAEIEPAGMEGTPAAEVLDLAKRVHGLVRRYVGNKPIGVEALPVEEPERFSDLVAAHLILPLAEKQALLEIFDTGERLTRLAAILEKVATPDRSIELLRHTVATLAYRGAKALRGAPAEFAEYRSASDSRTPVEILAHIGDLFDWALGMCDGRPRWHDSRPLAWEAEQARFFAALETFDRRLRGGTPLGFPAEQIFQGPIADALTHVGQIAMLRRMGGWKMRGENYFVAKVEVGRVGADQADAVQEFE